MKSLINWEENIIINFYANNYGNLHIIQIEET